MRESWFQHALSRQLLSLAFVVLCTGLVISPAAVRAQRPHHPGQAHAIEHIPYSTVRRGPPRVYDPARLAAFYGIDPAIVSAATLPYYHFDGQGYEVDMATFVQDQQGQGHGFRSVGHGQQYLGQPGQDVFRQVSGFGGPADGRGGAQPQSVPTITYDAPGGVSVYGTPDPYNAGGGMNFSPMTPPWLAGLDAGIYANDDQVLFTLGGTIKLWEGINSAVAARVVANGAAYHHGPSKAGYSIDVWHASRIEVLGVGHLFKAGGLWDQQDDLHRAGFTLSGILFPEIAKAPPTFDFAFGFGGGSDSWGGRIREVADLDAQFRMGFIFFDIFRIGGSVQYWQWNNPIFDPNQSSAGGYVQLDLGQWVISADLQATEENAQGFVNVMWTPGRHHGSLHEPQTVNVAKTNSVQRYRSWMTSAPIRDMALRTGEPPDEVTERPTPAPFLIAGEVSVTCEFAFVTDEDGDMVADGMDVGVRMDPDDNEAADRVALNVTIANGTNVSISARANNSTTGPNMQFQVLNIGAMSILPGGMLASDNSNNSQFLVGDVAGGMNTVMFDVTVDGETRRFMCQFTEGQPLPQPRTFIFDEEGMPIMAMAPTPTQP